MTFNALDELRQAGVISSRTSPAAIDILGELSEEETRFLGSLDARLKEAMTKPEVVAHSEEGEEDAPCIGFACGSYGQH